MRTWKPPKRILAIDPGTKEIGVVLLEDSHLAYYAVKTLRNEGKPYHLLGQARRLIRRLIEELDPDLFVMEKPFFAKTKRSALLTMIANEMRECARRSRLRILELTPTSARKTVCNNPWAKKKEVAQTIVAYHFPELKRYLPVGKKWHDKYWLHVFDATALALAVLARRTRRP